MLFRDPAAGEFNGITLPSPNLLPTVFTEAAVEAGSFADGGLQPFRGDHMLVGGSDGDAEVVGHARSRPSRHHCVPGGSAARAMSTPSPRPAPVTGQTFC